MTFPIEMNERHMGFARDVSLGLQRPCCLPALAPCTWCVHVSDGEPEKMDIGVTAVILQVIYTGH